VKGKMAHLRLIWCALCLGGVLTASAQNSSERPPLRGQESQPPPTGTPTDDWAVMLTEGGDPDAIAQALGFQNMGSIAGLADTYLFRYPGSAVSQRDAAEAALRSASQIVWYEQQIAVQQQLRPPDGAPSASLSLLVWIPVSIIAGVVLWVRFSQGGA